MAALGDYTSTEAIRACLGVDDSDVPDSYIIDSSMQVELELNLDEWLPDHASIITGTDRSAKLLKIYSQWYCGYLLTQRPMAMVQEFTDGKSGMKRFNLNQDSLIDSALSQAEHYKKLLQKEQGLTDSTVENFSFISISTPTVDPVTSS
ncbi:hypothetical protein [Endozoicomonas sp. ALC066]|uniref:hypothetical protein n=1 Tax=Endozoicomonas sp. ALC066 TaxID=3403078 RepID=UPI003BB48CBB